MENQTMLPKSLVWILGLILIVFLALFTIDKGFEVRAQVSNKNPKNTISVSAEGKAKAVPDLATVNLGVLTQGKDPAEVQSENSKKINRIIDFIKQQGISKDDISTSNFNIFPQRNYSNGREEIVGYQANQTITIRVRGVDESTEKLGTILSGATNNGANEINGVSLSFDDPDELRQQAREEAVRKAKGKADELAQAAGLKLGKVITISEGGSSYPSPMPYYGEGFGGGYDMAQPKSVSPNIEPGTQDIVQMMTVTFEIK